jgi:hypothetical protein
MINGLFINTDRCASHENLKVCPLLIDANFWGYLVEDLDVVVDGDAGVVSLCEGLEADGHTWCSQYYKVGEICFGMLFLSPSYLWPTGERICLTYQTSEPMFNAFVAYSLTCVPFYELMLRDAIDTAIS